MRDPAPQPILLADYRPPAYLVDEVHLTFRLDPGDTRVISRIRFRPNPEAPGPFRLDGEAMELIWSRIDGAPASPEITAEGLTCAVPDGPFTWEAEVRISPEANSALEGLYISRGMYCTQCEAEGFRRITYYPDRPDVLAPFTVRIESPLPVLLSNGNPHAEGPGWAEWHDPWPKPSYLFALVAGDLVAHRDSFTTVSGREVALAVWVRRGDEGKCAWAMEALKKSMAWDEEVYGREYDLDVFSIVAVDDFNMGAMENKGLNIFNSAVVLASPDTATDTDFERIEAIIAHEYFHNWTGNRITCRDWFQLCLKEGLTVFRDQQFTADMRSEPVKRISDVLLLRARQFREDAGPLAHPVRPESFVEINNFYTATVYEKGAEIIGMLRRLVGPEAYARALALYFERFDGTAATVEDWLSVFEESSGRDLAQFKLWYSQAGTPHVKVAERREGDVYRLDLRQHTPPTPGQPTKAPLVIPLAVGLLAPDGAEAMPTCVLELDAAGRSFAFRETASGWEHAPELDTDLSADPARPATPQAPAGAPLGHGPVPSLLRGFSAPIILEREQSDAECVFLLAHDTDPFVRWQSGHRLALRSLAAMALEGVPADPALLDASLRTVADESLDPAFRALTLRLPGNDEVVDAISARGATPDPARIRAAGQALERARADRFENGLPGGLAAMLDALATPGPYSPEAGPAGRRALSGALLALLNRLDDGARAQVQYDTARNMTDRLSAFACLLRTSHRAEAAGHFHARWRDDWLVTTKWFGLQIATAEPEEAVAEARRLAARPDFDARNPNRLRAVVGAVTGYPAAFHAADGSGYDFLAEWLVRIDGFNPQMAARLSTGFETFARYDAGRQAHARAALARVAAHEGLSRDLAEMVGRIRAG
jgi:aminopeptidase N